MSQEFESMEEYWQKKLEDERNFYENQLKNNEQMFKELELKMKEYEDLHMKSESGDLTGSDEKLSTIEESVSLENQVTEWEEEILQLNIKICELKKTHQEQMNGLISERSKRVDVLEMEKEHEWKIFYKSP